MSYTSDGQCPQERLSDTSPGFQGDNGSGMVRRKKEDVHVSAFSSNQDNTQSMLSPLQMLQVRLGLGILSDEQGISIDTLLSNLFSTQWTTRVAAIQTLAALGKQAPRRVVRAFASALQDDNEYVRTASAHALAQFEEQAPKTELILAMGDPAWTVRAAAIRALGKLGPGVPVETLINALRDDDDPAVRMAAVSALGNLKRPETLHHLIYALDDEDPFVRIAVIQAIGEQREYRSIRALMKALHDPDEDVRGEALKTIGAFEGKIPIKVFLTALNDKSEEVRLLALQALEKREDEQIPLEPLLQALKDSSEQIRTNTSRLLGRLILYIPKRLSSTFLCNLLQDETEQIRTVAAWALGEQRQITANEVLSQALDDPSHEVRSAVTWALHELASIEKRTLSSSPPLIGPYHQASLHLQSHHKKGEWGNRQDDHVQFLTTLATYLEDKRGYVHPELKVTATGYILVLICGYQNHGHSFQDVLNTLARPAPVACLSEALNCDDEAIRLVATQTIKEHIDREWTEFFIASLELKQDADIQPQHAIPNKIILCSIGSCYVHITDAPVLGKIIHTLQQEAICEYSSQLEQKRRKEGCFEDNNAQAQTTMIAESMISVDNLSPAFLGKALKDCKFWYSHPDEKTGGNYPLLHSHHAATHPHFTSR